MPYSHSLSAGTFSTKIVLPASSVDEIVRRSFQFFSAKFGHGLSAVSGLGKNVIASFGDRTLHDR